MNLYFFFEKQKFITTTREKNPQPIQPQTQTQQDTWDLQHLELNITARKKSNKTRRPGDLNAYCDN